MNIGPSKWSTVRAVLLSAVALVSAASASADPSDDAFVAALANFGINIDGRDTVIAHGHAVCDGLDRGQDSSFLAMKLINDRQLDLTSRQAGFFIGASVAAYCPQYRGSVDPSLIWLLPFPPMM